MDWLGLFAKKKYVENQPRGNRKLISFSGGTLINGDTAMEVSAFYRGVTYISTQIAKLPWEVKDSNLEVLRNNRINKLLNVAPNDETNAFMFRVKIIADAIIYGNGYAEVERDMAGRVVALWPIGHNDVYPQRNENGVLEYRVVGGGHAGTDVILKKNDIYHVRNFHTKDGILGLGLLDYAAETLGTAKGSEKFANALFSNGGLPSGVLETDTKLSDSALDRLLDTWKSKYGGIKTGGTAILEDGLKYKAVSHDPQVLQFLESRKFSVLDIARFLGLPPTKLFDTEAATFNNIENANLEVATDTLDAWARNLEVEANVKLLANSFNGVETQFNMRHIFRGDMKTRGTYFKDRMQTGSITPNEIRAMEGDAPYTGGEKYYIATNNYTPQDRVDDVIDSQVNKPENTEDEVNKEIANYLKAR